MNIHTQSSSKLEKLRNEQKETNRKLEKAVEEQKQIEHKLRQAENREEYFKKRERKARTHRLCIKGGAIESIVPGLKDFPEKEFYNLMEMVFSLPQVQSLVEGKINHRKQRSEDNRG
ncbi:MAG: DUF3847 domain-containing protein [Eubacteriales bacterium]|jgi:chromosome segregation ATPase